MFLSLPRAAAIMLLLAICLAFPAVAQDLETRTVDRATTVLQEVMSLTARSIPETLLADAQGVAIIPDVVKLGFVVGGRFGRGVVLVRDEAGTWSPPSFITLTGGSFGWQAGVQATDVVLVFRTRRSIEGLLQGKFTIGADAAVAAGPVGREAAAATDATLRAEILSYSRSRGLFAGVALDGSVIQMDVAANSAYYQVYGAGTAPLPIQNLTQIPPSAERLREHLSRYSVVRAVAPAAYTGELPGPVSGSTGDMARRRLQLESTQLQRIVDPAWKTFLALPAEVYQGVQPPPAEVLRQKLAQFEQVERDPQYAALAERPEFQGTIRALRDYLQTLPAVPALELPPPPQ